MTLRGIQYSLHDLLAIGRDASWQGRIVQETDKEVVHRHGHGRLLVRNGIHRDDRAQIVRVVVHVNERAVLSE